MSTGRATRQKDLVRVHIRWMIRRDMPDVLRTETESFDFAWTEEDFLRCLRQRNCIGMVAEYNDKVVGFMIYELHKTKLHILNFAVAPRFRRMGIAEQMVSKLIGKLSSHRRTKITLAVSADADALKFKIGGTLDFELLGLSIHPAVEIELNLGDAPKSLEAIGKALLNWIVGHLEVPETRTSRKSPGLVL